MTADRKLPKLVRQIATIRRKYKSLVAFYVTVLKEPLFFCRLDITVSCTIFVCLSSYFFSRYAEKKTNNNKKQEKAHYYQHERRERKILFNIKYFPRNCTIFKKNHFCHNCFLFSEYDLVD